MNDKNKIERRDAVYAGSFYPKDKNEIKKMINSFLKNDLKKLNGKLKGLIVPHAGYIYSGVVAGYGFKLLKESKKEKIILFGPSHHNYLEGAFGFSGNWITPLGETKIVSIDLPIILNDKEHSLEVQLPFLQSIIPNSKLTITPIIYGDISSEELADIINIEKKDDSILIASSDLSHYLSYDIAKKVDSHTIQLILNLDFEKFLSEGDACGKIGIGALMILAKKNKWKTILLDYKNSGDTKGDKESVVGYACIAFIEEKK